MTFPNDDIIVMHSLCDSRRNYAYQCEKNRQVLLALVRIFSCQDNNAFKTTTTGTRFTRFILYHQTLDLPPLPPLLICPSPLLTQECCCSSLSLTLCLLPLSLSTLSLPLPLPPLSLWISDGIFNSFVRLYIHTHKRTHVHTYTRYVQTAQARTLSLSLSHAHTHATFLNDSQIPHLPLILTGTLKSLLWLCSSKPLTTKRYLNIIMWCYSSLLIRYRSNATLGGKGLLILVWGHFP